MLDTREKINRNKSKIKNIIIILSTLFALVVFSLGFLLWVSNTVKAKNSNSNESKYVLIESGQSLDEISNNLSKNGLVKNKFVFGLYLKYKGLSGSVQAGEYQIPRNLNMIDISQIITLGKIVTTKITIPEGWTNRKIAERIINNTIITESDWENAVKYDPTKYNYDFLSDLKRGDSLEGFLYPDTYQISLRPTAEELVTKMLDNFDKKLTKDDQDKIKKSGMSTFEVITLASIVEREVAVPEDRKLVASVFLNRLNADMALESCATIQYILNVSKSQFTYEETRTASPYNTYMNPGLPAGPIGNPSIDSIRAVIYPEKSDYYYFLSSEKKTYFSKTLNEHNTKKLQYLN